MSTPNLDNDDFMYGTTDYDEDGIIAKSSATASSSSKADDKKSSNSNITSNSLNIETMACGVVVPVVLTPVKKRDIFRNKIMEKDSIPNARDITIIGHQGQDNDSKYKARNKKWMERFCQLEVRLEMRSKFTHVMCLCFLHQFYLSSIPHTHPMAFCFFSSFMMIYNI